jgi:hypothetical protein
MPRRRPKTRVDHLVEALAAAESLKGALDEIELEDLSRDVQVAVRAALKASETAGKKVAGAIHKDVPVLQARRLASAS